ncbi:Uncharacterised protein [uncultured archaeon]|nr:Uncharacterised protein [uncultured archaeon]
MVKYKSILLFVLVIGIVVVSGCTDPLQPPPDKPLIESIQVQNNFIHQNSNEKTTIGYIIKNPLQITFNGKVEIQYGKPNCLTTYSNLEEFSIQSKKSLPFTVDISAYGSDQKCIGTQLVTLNLKDAKAADGGILDSKSVQINIAQR